jgi:anti-sigma B factor antagonist
MREFKLTAEVHGVQILSVEGELDLTVTDELYAAIKRSAASELLVVDLAECDFVDSTAIALFVHAAGELEAEGRVFRLRNARADVARVLSITGLFDRGFLDGDSSSEPDR